MTRRTHATARTLTIAGMLLSAATVSVAVAAPADAQSHPAACSGSQLGVSHTGSEGATGHGSMVLEFRNRSGHTCTLHGYPGFDAVGRQGKVKAHAKRTREGFTGGAHKIRTITVRPGHYASADVEWESISGSGSCRTASHFAFTPPNTTKTVVRRGPIPVCGLEVHPTVSGRSGQS